VSLLLLARAAKNHRTVSSLTKSLLHFEGANGSTTFTDEAGLTWTRSSTATISTAQSKFGSSSLLSSFGGIQTAGSAATTIGTGDATLEFVMYPNSFPGGSLIIADLRDVTHANEVAIYTSTGTLKLFAAGADRITGSTFTTGTWHHIAWCRASGVSRLFLDGTQVGSNYTDSNNYANTHISALAQYNGVGSSDAYMDEFRLRLSAEYTSNFTPPSAPFSYP
jgi:hypothetical protein